MPLLKAFYDLELTESRAFQKVYQCPMLALRAVVGSSL